MPKSNVNVENQIAFRLYAIKQMAEIMIIKGIGRLLLYFINAIILFLEYEKTSKHLMKFNGGKF